MEQHCEHCGAVIDIDPAGTWVLREKWPAIGQAYCSSSPDHRHHPAEVVCTPLTFTVDETRVLYHVLDTMLVLGPIMGSEVVTMLNSLRTAVAESLPPGVEVTP